MNPNFSEKSLLREQMLRMRKAIPEAERRSAEVRILRHLNQLEAVRGAEGLGLYWSVGSEVSTHDAFRLFHSQGKHLFLPRGRLGEKPLEMVEVTTPKDLALGAFGTYEPSAHLSAAGLGDFQVLLVPGLAFDGTGNRLGRGAGFYDRLLMDYHGLKIGLAFTGQILERVPTESHDLAMDLVITEAGVLKAEK